RNYYYLLDEINKEFKKDWSTDLFSLITKEEMNDVNAWYIENKENLNGKMQRISETTAEIGPLYRHPRKMWGIGLNYVEHAADLSEVAPNTEPASFMKPDTTIIGEKE